MRGSHAPCKIVSEKPTTSRAIAYLLPSTEKSRFSLGVSSVQANDIPESQTFLTNFCEVTSVEKVEITFESALVYNYSGFISIPRIIVATN